MKITFQMGDKVKIIKGPYKGHFGRFVGYDDRYEKYSKIKLENEKVIVVSNINGECMKARKRPLELEEARQLSVPEQHQLKIARDTLKMSPAMVKVMGGMSYEEAKAIIKKLTGKNESVEVEMNIEKKIEEYLNKKKILKEQNEFEAGEDEISDDVFELLNGLEDDYLSPDQVALKNKILSTLAPETGDFDEEEFDMSDDVPTEDMPPEDATEDNNEPADFPFDDTETIEKPVNIGNKELYGYDENDFTLADSTKNPFKLKKRLLAKRR